MTHPYSSKESALKSLLVLCRDANYDWTIVKYRDGDLIRDLECPDLSDVKKSIGDKWGEVWDKVLSCSARPQNSRQ